jgi:hypothetical protein
MRRRLAVAMVSFAFLAGPAGALDAAVDGDVDDVHDDVEFYLGSDTGNASSTPEHPLVGQTCLDGLDNDADGSIDLDDSSCAPIPPPFDGTFPPAGLDMFESTMSLDAYDFDLGGGSLCQIDLQAEGPTIIDRQDPIDIGGGQMQIPVELVAMQLSGTADVLGGTNCPIPPGGTIQLTIYHGAPSQGAVTEQTIDPATDFPADSFFDISFVVEIPGLAPLPGGPPGGPPGTTLRVSNVIHTLPPYHGGMNPNCYEVAGLEHEHCPKAPPDHFLCYKGKFSPKFQKRDVLLQDQFDPIDVQHTVTKPVWHCNPASKDAEPLYEETGHLKCYKMKPQKQKQIVTVRNQFGMSTVETKKSQMLCLPTEKDSGGPPETLDDYQCYNAKFSPKFAKRDVTMLDQWQTVSGQVKKPQFLCNPVSLDGGGIANPLRHLTCYSFKAPKFQQSATLANEFGDETVLVKKPVAVCVPSSKTFDSDEPMLEYGVEHGDGMSNFCFAVTKGEPGATGSISLTGGGFFEQQDVQLDASGEFRGGFTIFQFGAYGLSLSLGGVPPVALELPANVDDNEVACP